MLFYKVSVIAKNNKNFIELCNSNKFVDSCSLMDVDTDENNKFEDCKGTDKEEIFVQYSKKNNDILFVGDALEMDNAMMFALGTNKVENQSQEAESFLRHLGIVPEKMKIDEITFEDFFTLLQTSIYISDVNIFLKKIRRAELVNYNMFSNRYEEHILENESIIDKNDCSFSKINLQYSKSYNNELNRIYACPTPECFEGNLVNYVLLDNENPARNTEAIERLLGALYNKKRIVSKRYSVCIYESVISADGESLFSENLNGTIVISNEKEDTIDGMGFDCMFADEEQEEKNIEKLLKYINKYQDDVLTILCLEKDSKLYNAIVNKLDKINAVRINLDAEGMNREMANKYVHLLSEDRNIALPVNFIDSLEFDENGEIDGSTIETAITAFKRNNIKRIYGDCYGELFSVKTVTKMGTQKLEKMIALSQQKKMIHSIVNYIHAKAERSNNKAVRPTLHMLFTGNPGTAKTSVARIVAEIFADEGIIKENKFVEVGRGDLVAKYVGWTAKNVVSQFQRAENGVLFIDEAYSLIDDTFGKEAIDTIVQEMENHRDNVIVILAGYKKEMEALLNTNPGLKSRIPFHIDFPDYNNAELLKIADVVAENLGLSIDEVAKESLIKYFEAKARDRNFGNGRFVRNLIERAEMNQVNRVMESRYTEDNLTKLILDDFTLEDLKPENKAKTRTIGFAV